METKSETGRLKKLKKLIKAINMNGKLLGALIALFFVAFGCLSAALLVWAADIGLFFPIAFVMFTVYIVIFAYLMDKKH